MRLTNMNSEAAVHDSCNSPARIVWSVVDAATEGPAAAE